MSGANLITFEGCNYFRQRLILATLSGKTVRIKKIRSKEDDPGLKGVYRPIISCFRGTCTCKFFISVTVFIYQRLQFY